MGSVSEDGQIHHAPEPDHTRGNAIVWAVVALVCGYTCYCVGHSSGRLAESIENREIQEKQRENDARLLGVSATRFVGGPAKGDAGSGP